MLYDVPLSSGFTGAVNRSKYISPQSGMCSFCTEECTGTCEIAMAAVLGKQTVYPTTTGSNQIAGEKLYPLDWSHFNINGRVFGAKGTTADYENAEIYNVDLKTGYGRFNKVNLEMPVILPALIKLNWKDYFGGAAMAGVSCVIGEDSKSKDPDLVMKNGVVTDFPWIGKVLHSFNRYYRGSGQIILQCNVEDDMVKIPEVAIGKYGAKAIEFKFGQSAKGTQPVNRLKNIEAARKKKAMGFIVKPDPEDPSVQKAYEDEVCPNFYVYSRLPQWDEEFMDKRVAEVRSLGAENVTFKMAGYDPQDMERVLRMAVSAGVDMVTFDGAGGGSGYSPCHMMNEWGLPVVNMEAEIVRICRKLESQGLELPAITVTGGFATEDQLFKALAFGEGYITCIGVCRASMAAAMTAKSIGERICSGKVPAQYKNFGNSIEEIFGDLPDLRAIYGKEANDFSPGAIGVFSYLNKLAFGLQHFAALNRKFKLDYLDRRDLIPLTEEARGCLNK